MSILICTQLKYILDRILKLIILYYIICWSLVMIGYVSRINLTIINWLLYIYYSIWVQVHESRFSLEKMRVDTREARLTRLKKITLASVAERNRSSGWTKRLCRVKQGRNIRVGERTRFFFFFFFFFPPSFLSSFSFPERLVAADGHSICFLVNFQPDNLDWIRKKIGKIDITRNEIHFKN